MSAIQNSILPRLPNPVIDRVAGFLPYPHALEQVSHHFSDKKEMLFANTWKMYLSRLQEGPDPIIGGLVKDTVCHYSLNGPLKADKAVQKIAGVIRSRALRAPGFFFFSSKPQLCYGRRSLSELARAIDIINFFKDIAANLPLANAAVPHLFEIVKLLPLEQQNIQSFAIEVSRWMTYNISALETIQTNSVDIDEFTGLKHRFAHIPPLVGLLRGLERISYGDMNEKVEERGTIWLRDLPQEIQFCTNLREADLCHNMFESIPLPLLNCRRLESLNLAFNKITILPPEIGQLEELQILRLDGNDLESLPSEFGNLTTLTRLCLNKNSRLANLPEEFWNLTSLQRLRLSYTSLTSLSKGIGRLTSLRMLSVRHCKIKDIPAELAQCVRLRLVDLRKNPLERSNQAIRAILPFVPPGDSVKKLGLFLSSLREVREEKKEAAEKR